MNLKKFKPITPSLRFLVRLNKSNILTKTAFFPLLLGKTKTAGRNSSGKITVYHRGGGNKKNIRILDYKRLLWNVNALVLSIEYDPYRSSFIALLKYTLFDNFLMRNVFSYILSPHLLRPGDLICAGSKGDLKPGFAMLLKNIPFGFLIHNIELIPGNGGIFVRSAGTFGQIIRKLNSIVTVRLPSRILYDFREDCMATIGVVSNLDNKNIVLGKAGSSRWLGRRPVVRGVAMNPVDHPHGGNTSGGRPSVTPWGIPTKGFKTVKKKKKKILSFLWHVLFGRVLLLILV